MRYDDQTYTHLWVNTEAEKNTSRFVNTHPFKYCSKGKHDQPPEGGVDMGTKWVCLVCWNKHYR